MSARCFGGLLACLVGACGADFTGTYEGRRGDDSYRIRLTQHAGTVVVDSLRVELESQAPCALAAGSCSAVLAPDGLGLAARGCTVRLGGHAGRCAGELAFDLDAHASDAGAFVRELSLETTLDGAQVTLRRVPTECSDERDNDGDARVDHPADPECADGHDDREAPSPPPPACGLGPELVPLFAALAWAQRKAR
jgi:hypothetical protein